MPKWRELWLFWGRCSFPHFHSWDIWRCSDPRSGQNNWPKSFLHLQGEMALTSSFFRKRNWQKVWVLKSQAVTELWLQKKKKIAAFRGVFRRILSMGRDSLQIIYYHINSPEPKFFHTRLWDICHIWYIRSINNYHLLSFEFVYWQYYYDFLDHIIATL